MIGPRFFISIKCLATGFPILSDFPQLEDFHDYTFLKITYLLLVTFKVFGLWMTD